MRRMFVEQANAFCLELVLQRKICSQYTDVDVHSFEQPTNNQWNACSFACAANIEQATFWDLLAFASVPHALFASTYGCGRASTRVREYTVTQARAYTVTQARAYTLTQTRMYTITQAQAYTVMRVYIPYHCACMAQVRSHLSFLTLFTDTQSKAGHETYSTS